MTHENKSHAKESSMQSIRKLDRAVVTAVAVAALGYFVDIYDLLLFGIVRIQSLRDIGVPENELLEKGVLLLNWQMAGLLIGGIFWGVLGDKKGRLSVLFGSIFLYSAANLANAFVNSVEMYVALRFIAGIGLAGELGAGITLVSEIMPKAIRGLGTTVVAAFGILGAVFGGVIGEVLSWKAAYILGGVMGFAILLLRVGVHESGMFANVAKSAVERGNFLSIFKRRKSLLRYLGVIIIGVPIWYVVGILVTFSPEFGRAFGMSEAELPTPAKSIMFSYLGIAIGDMASGILSQWLKSRKKVIYMYLAITAIAVALHLGWDHHHVEIFYLLNFFMGFGAGYWALFVTVAAEQFGTNIRSTVATTAPNFVRGATILLTTMFTHFKSSMGVVNSAAVVGVIAFASAFLAMQFLEETFHKDLNYTE